MKAHVVDTNVAIVANARDTHADMTCQQNCVKTLRSLTSDGVVAIDDADLILKEYSKHLNHSGQPGVGDMFFKHLFYNKWQSARVHRVSISPVDDHAQGFNELPPNSLDPSDRKFLAVAVAANAVILNATDSDWNEQAALTAELGVEVKQLCPQHATKQV